MDNLPPALFARFIELCCQHGKKIRNVDLGIDIRERGFFSEFFTNLRRLKKNGYRMELLFLDASDPVPTRRFSESRRPHPLLPQQPVLKGIRLERERLRNLRKQADLILDTSDFTVHDLRDWMSRHYGPSDSKQSMCISLLTFGYKFGVPYDVDLLFDVRFLKNPNFVPNLKRLTGEDKKVKWYILENRDAEELLRRLTDLFSFLFPFFEPERRSYLTIAVGCTGGRHRSVAVASRLRESLTILGYEVTIRHRDIQQVSSP